MKKIIISLLALIMVLGIAGCSSKKDNEPTPPAEVNSNASVEKEKEEIESTQEYTLGEGWHNSPIKFKASAGFKGNAETHWWKNFEDKNYAIDYIVLPEDEPADNDDPLATLAAFEAYEWEIESMFQHALGIFPDFKLEYSTEVKIGKYNTLLHEGDVSLNYDTGEINSRFVAYSFVADGNQYIFVGVDTKGNRQVLESVRKAIIETIKTVEEQ